MDDIDHKVGEKIIFLKMNAIIRYIGNYHEKPGLWIGLEVDVPKGKNNGTIKGVKYFECEPNHGFFLQYETFVKALGATSKSTKPHQDVIPENKMSPSKSNSDFSSVPIHPRMIPVSTSMAEFEQPQSIADRPSLLIQNIEHSQAPSNDQPQSKQNSQSSAPQPQQPKAHQESTNSQQIPLQKIGSESIQSSSSTPNISLNQNIPPTQTQSHQVPKTSRPPDQENIGPSDVNSTPFITSESASASSVSSSRLTDPETIIAKLNKKCQEEFQKIKNDAKKYKDIQAKIAQKDENFKSEVEKKKNELKEQMMQIQLKYMPDQMKLEEDLLKYARNEKIAKKKSMKKGTHQSIEVLQQINEEHIKFENSFRELINKQAMKFDSKKNKFNLLNAKLKSQYELSDEQEKTINELQQKISAYDKELTEKLPVSKETTDLKIKIASLQSTLDRNEKKYNIYNIDCNVADYLFKKIETLFSPIVSTTAIIYRLIEKANLLLNTQSSTTSLENVEKATLEEILHMCDTAIMAFGWNDSRATSELSTFAHELSEIENNIDNEIIPSIDASHMMALLQSVTPLPLNLAITSHLIKSVMYRTKNPDYRDELKDFAKQFPRIFHPSQMLKNREECEKFCLTLRAEIRKPEKNDKSFSVMKYLTQLQSFLTFQTKEEDNNKDINLNQSYSIPANLIPKFKLIASQELILANNEAEKKAIEKEEEGLPELRRKVADLDSVYNQLKKYNCQLSQLKIDLPDRIQKMKDEIDESEELIKEIEADMMNNQ